MRDALIVVDPQNDFCDQRGSLYVDGAAADIARLSRYIGVKGDRISSIFVSMDSHDSIAIFHPGFWVSGTGGQPSPYARIAPGDLLSGKWEVRCAENRPFAEKTFSAMRRKGEEALMVWPEHCVISTWGHQIADTLREALRGWREKTGKAVRYVFKGENPFTDQFSIFEGVDDSYPETAFNESLFRRLSKFETVTFAGEAISHCVRESILHYMAKLNSAGQTKQKIRLLADCSSAVSGFDKDESLSLLERAGVEFVSAEA